MADTYYGYSTEEEELVEGIVQAYMKHQCGWQNTHSYHGHTDCQVDGIKAALEVLRNTKGVEWRGQS